MNEPAPDRRPPARKHNTWLETISGVLASFIGVQSSKNRHRDFTRGKASHFIIVGLVMTVLLVLSLALAVNLLIKFAG